MSQFDNRIFKVELTYGTTKLTLDGGLWITAQGSKYLDATQNECTIQIANLKKETRDQLATNLTRYNLNSSRKSVKLYAGRMSTGLFLLYSGDIIECSPSQPPNIVTTIKAKSLQWFKYNILAQAQNASAPMSQLGNAIGTSLGIPVHFEATDRNVSNWSYNGSAAKQIDKLNSLGGIDAFEDNGTLYIKDAGTPLKDVSHVLSMDSGMIGLPEITEYGVRVRMLLTPGIRLGGQLTLKSLMNPSLNGNYSIYQLGFDIASREAPFYAIASCTKFPQLFNAAAGLGNLQ
jgi:Baseplate hub gp41